jgi:hypothetical protein
MRERLSKINPNFYFEVALADPTMTGIYLPCNDPTLRTHKTPSGAPILCVCGMGTGMMPEFSVIEGKPRQIPDPNASGGYRTEMVMDKELRGGARCWRCCS